MNLRKSLSIFLILTMTGVFGGVSVLAQTKPTKQERKSAKVEEKLKKLGIGEKAKVKVELYNATTYQGYLSEANDEDFVVIDKGGNPNRLRYADVDKIGGSNLSTGAKIAIGIGIGIGALLILAAYAVRHLGD
ncbi:MAG: hypothetical protein ACKVQW_10590 [Pyrinomonadaceae bacterium]